MQCPSLFSVIGLWQCVCVCVSSPVVSAVTQQQQQRGLCAKPAQKGQQPMSHPVSSLQPL